MSSELINDELSDNEWCEVSISDLCLNIYSGGTPKSTEPKYFENGVIPWLKTKEVNYSKITETENFITTDGLKSSSAKLVPVNSVIVAMYGNGDTAGRVAINKIELTTNQACCNLVIDPEKADYRFVYYYLMSQYSKLVDLKNGGAQQNLNSKLIKEFPILIPEVATQREIGAFLESLDDRIALLRETNTTLEAIAQALFKSWFVDFAPVHANAGTQAPSLPAEIQALFPSSLVESPQGLIPEGWEVGCIGDVVSVKGGYAFKSADFQDIGLPVIKIKNIVGDGTVDVTDVQKVSETVASKAQRFALQSGDILMAMTGATIGKVGVFVSENDETAYLNQRVAKFENKGPDQKNTWLAFIAFSNAFMAEQIVNAASGSAQPNISSAGIESARLVVPSNKKVLKAFNDLVEPLFVGWINNQKTIRTLANLRDTLLPRLISGQLRLPEAEAALANID